MSKKKISLYYNKQDIGEGLYQHVLLILDGEKKYGMVTCPKENYFHKVLKEEVEDFHSSVEEKHSIFFSFGKDKKSKKTVKGLIKKIKQDEEHTLPLKEVGKVFEVCGIPKIE